MTHGTAPPLGSFAEINAMITRALPKALADIDPVTLLHHMNRDGAGLERTLGEALRAFVGIAPNSYPVIVPYEGGTTINKLVVRGNYNWYHTDITNANFPQGRKVAEEVVVELVHFNHDISSDNALKKLGQRGLRATNPAELLAFGAKYPKIQLEFPIVALGQHWPDHFGRRRVVYLGGSGGRRQADLDWLDVDWLRDHRFAAVRK